ncbi:MAG: hypothetical protein V4567_12525 [Pseudomonadota bacterium]
MTRLLFVAPGVAPPLTEGRKLFVTELAELLRQRGIEVEVLNGGNAAGIRAIARSLRDLRRRIGTVDRVTAVFAFPYGTYTGLRAHANRFLVSRVTSMCETAGVFSRPVFYSCAGLSFEEFCVRYRPGIAVGRAGDGMAALCLGTSRELPQWSPLDSAPAKLLFLCGYQTASSAALRNVLYQRGLIDALRAGSALAAADASLTIAIPFLRDPGMRQRVSSLVDRLCPELRITMVDSGSPITLLANHDVFLFPYRAQDAVFIPTSLLEAIQVGIPALVSDQTCYRSLTTGATAAGCRLHPAGDWRALADQFMRMKQEYAGVVSGARTSAAIARITWTLSRSADELLAAIPALSR